MIVVTKEEAQILRKEVPDVVIYKTCPQRSSRGKRYAEPTFVVLKILKELREVDFIEI